MSKNTIINIKKLISVSAILISFFYCNQLIAAPAISNIITSSSTGLYEKLEVSFSVSTIASNLFWPYDTSPVTGVPAGVGVSVDGLFLAPNTQDWSLVIIQPGFYYQDYTLDSTNPDRSLSNNRTWIYPSGSPVWKIRFAPTQTGTWKFKIKVKDASGESYSSEMTFECTPSTNNGFWKTNDKDSRYFVRSDGTYTPLIGLANDTGNISSMESQYSQLENMGVNFIRTWWQSSNPSLALFGSSGQGGDLNWNNLNSSTEQLLPSRIVVAKLDNNSLWTTVGVKPNTNYRMSAYVKTVGLTGGAINLNAWPCGLSGDLVTGNTDWKTVSFDFKTDDRYEITWLSVSQGSPTSGAAYVANVSLKEILPGGGLGGEILSRADMQAHTSYPQAIAWTIDKQLEIAKQHNIFIKAVIEEKSDGFFASIQQDGKWGSFSNDNVYASETHPSRTYQKYFWRYIIARYGYSTALHSVEFSNEADPHNGLHHGAVAALSDYFSANDPNKHLTSTSNWHSFPPLMWKQSSIPMADIHMYLGWSVASGGNRIWPGWDGSWVSPNSASDLSSAFSFDSTQFYSGSKSFKMVIPGGGDPAGGGASRYVSDANFQIGIISGHQIKMSVWVKADNLKNATSSTWKCPGFYMYYSSTGGDYASAPGDFKIDINGTYTWTKYEKTFTVPNDVYILTVLPTYWANCLPTPASLWFDDLVIQDITTGKVLNYNGGFEYTDSESYDVVAGHSAYAKLVSSYQLGKPVIRGETGFSYPQRFSNPYKGFDFKGEDQLLIDDIEGIWWKKWVWSQAYADSLYEIYWFPEILLNRGYTYAKSFNNFMNGIELANGNYKDILADTSTPNLRVLGQKDLVNNNAFMWIDNAKYTWKNVVDHSYQPPTWNSTSKYAVNSVCVYGSPSKLYKSLANNNINNLPTIASSWQDMGLFSTASNPALANAISGTINIAGLADGNYKVEWWNTSTGSIINTTDITSSSGIITLNVTNLASDIACKIVKPDTKIDLKVIVPSNTIVPGQIITVTVEYTNNSDGDAIDVVVAARIPAGTDYISGSAEGNGTYDAAAKTVSWVVPMILHNSKGTRTFQVKVI